MVFVNGDSNKSVNIDFILYLIKPGDKMILVDAGCETMPGSIMKNFIGTTQALKNANIPPDKITDVFITHSHHDHIECVKYFKNVVIHIENSEYNLGKQYIPENFRFNKFVDKFVICDNVTVIKIGGHSVGSCIVEVNYEEDTYILTGDECYTRDNLTKKIPTGISVCPEKSKMFVEKYSDKKYKTILAHDG